MKIAFGILTMLILKTPRLYEELLTQNVLKDDIYIFRALHTKLSNNLWYQKWRSIGVNSFKMYEKSVSVALLKNYSVFIYLEEDVNLLHNSIPNAHKILSVLPKNWTYVSFHTLRPIGNVISTTELISNSTYQSQKVEIIQIKQCHVKYANTWKNLPNNVWTSMHAFNVKQLMMYLPYFHKKIDIKSINEQFDRVLLYNTEKFDFYSVRPYCQVEHPYLCAPFAKLKKYGIQFENKCKSPFTKHVG